MKRSKVVGLSKQPIIHGFAMPEPNVDSTLGKALRYFKAGTAISEFFSKFLGIGHRHSTASA